MSVDNISRYNSFGKIVSRAEKPDAIAPQAPAQKGKSFSDILGEAVKEVDKTEIKSNELIQHMVVGDKPVQVHEAMIALQKADTAFQLMNRVRSKVVRAYEEIMRTPV